MSNLMKSAATSIAVFGMAAAGHAALVVDVRLLDGGKAAAVTAVGNVVNMNVYARVTGADALNNDGFQAIYGSFLSTGAIEGTLAAGRVAPFTGTSSSDGAQVDLDADGDLDVGSNTNTSSTGFFYARSNAMETSGTVIPGGEEFLVGTLAFTVTELSAGGANINFRPRVTTFNGVWNVDGANKNGGNDTYAAGSPVTIAVPEPTTLSLLALGGAALIRRRRQA